MKDKDGNYYIVAGKFSEKADDVKRVIVNLQKTDANELFFTVTGEASQLYFDLEEIAVVLYDIAHEDDDVG